ncbi:hypothetical protein CEXT_337661 [Caerostris extrusa]|uniref:Uncharacterized protein n=1 Tax=Caerostris extrusa TaxID=172846 RepID=A0AAV4QJJ8_CAEEX|nr:hypothetical protein CEXT_337661 [Caerostris extrusa]
MKDGEWPRVRLGKSNQGKHFSAGFSNFSKQVRSELSHACADYGCLFADQGGIWSRGLPDTPGRFLLQDESRHHFGDTYLL